jgi:hypothetical protein
MLLWSAGPPCLHDRLSSNVRPHNKHRCRRQNSLTNSGLPRTRSANHFGPSSWPFARTEQLCPRREQNYRWLSLRRKSRSAGLDEQARSLSSSFIKLPWCCSSRLSRAAVAWKPREQRHSRTNVSLPIRPRWRAGSNADARGYASCLCCATASTLREQFKFQGSQRIMAPATSGA